MPSMTPSVLQAVSIESLIDMVHGPFSDPKVYSNTMKRIILTRILGMLKTDSPLHNADYIAQINVTLKKL